MPLTNTAIKALKPLSKTKRYFDGKGMYLEVSPKGSKCWRLKYRVNGKEKRISLGVYPEVSLKEARDKCDEARRMLAKGIDPSAHRQAQKRSAKQSAENSFEAVARQWFAKMRPKWAASHADKVIRRLELYVFPAIGSMAIAEVEPADVLDAIRAIEDQGKVETAHRTLQHCGQVFRFAVAERTIKSDPTRDLRGSLAATGKTKHFSALTDPNSVASLLKSIYGYEGTPVVQAALKLAALTFVRPGELRQARWQDINLDEAQWRYTVSKTDTDHIVPLSRQAVEILIELHRLTGRGEYVFPSARSASRAMSDNAVLAALRTMGIPKEEMSGHGFRAMARTLLDEVLGFRVDYIEHQLAHAVKDPNGRAYNRTTFLAERTAMMQTWADYLDQLRTGSNVVGGGFGAQK